MSIKYKYIDFTELESGDDFELLIRELLYNKGLEVYWSGKGPDGGRDLLCIENYNSEFKNSSKRWLVQCKNNAKSGNSVGREDLGTIVNDCNIHNAEGYILICSTYPSSAAVEVLEGIEKNFGILTCFWDYKMIELMLMRPDNWSLINTFFPKSAKKIDLQIAQLESDFWRICYKGYVFYYSLRLGTNFNNYFYEAMERVSELESLVLPEGHFLRLRAIYYDDKYCNYKIYYDYLLPQGTKEADFHPTQDLIELFNERCVEGLFWEPDVIFYEVNRYSDSFDLDDKAYYSRFLEEFHYGIDRHYDDRFRNVFKDDTYEITEENKSISYERFIKMFDSLEYVSILNESNSEIENIGLFSDNFDWSNFVDALNYNVNNFFEASVRFQCTDFDKLIKLVEKIPQSVDKYFFLDRNLIVIPDDGYEKEENSIFTFHICIHPAYATSKQKFRYMLNDYLDTITGIIKESINTV